MSIAASHVESQLRNSVVSIPQNSETAVQAGPIPAFTYRYAYARSSDTQAANKVGQDYLTFHDGGSHFCFALCDGVSMSFYGGVAARILGDALLRWLKSDIVTTYVDAREIQAALTAHLKDLTRSAREQMTVYPPPADLQPMQRQAWEQIRDKGGESIFVCGRVDLPSSQFLKGRVLLSWMGDARLRIWAASGQELSSELGGEFRKIHRWSTRNGPIGALPHVFVQPLQHNAHDLKRIVAYSDGLKIYDDYIAPITSRALEQIIAQANGSSDSDDISFIEIWLGAMPELAESTRPANLVLDDAGVESNRLRLSVRPPGIDFYEVEVGAEQSQLWKVTKAPELPIEMQNLEPGRYQIRMRTVHAGQPGDWSNELQVAIPEVSPATKTSIPVQHGSATTGQEMVGEVSQQSPNTGDSEKARSTAFVRIFGWIVSGALLAVLLLAVPDDGPLRGFFVSPTLTPIPTLLPADTATPTATASPSPLPPTPSVIPTVPTEVPELGLAISDVQTECIEGCSSSSPYYSLRVVASVNGGVPPYTFLIGLTNDVPVYRDPAQPGMFILYNIPRCIDLKMIVAVDSSDGGTASVWYRHFDSACSPIISPIITP